ncbi:DgaE family pyridoxal phosphate-dependent ammonia lyase [Radiobacillus kanasensis]|uniref:DgaE family pyridoxal phosphate-dependent ammonia lyase n=1 Tax=Radiobacillus kanasensis TaxID=2844358 RepID=UPI001E2B9FD9|nr:DgaE family pyridoxal phosphate-dependent ammonia lyase [Radiobacillus kanasensis]UFT98682.1 DgaE family pyridoxal phosphate-dependent ammonia lyase [Radiobacillus kanasensis]
MANSWNAKYGLKRVINASGRMSILGVSTPSDSVMNAMKYGGQHYVEMADLVDKGGEYVASILGSEAAVIVNSASSGIALSVAALITKGNRRLSERLHQEEITPNDVIILKGHNVQYGAPIETMVYLGGGRLVEVGYANEGKVEHIEESITNNTTAILYVQSHHAVQKNMISVEEAWEIAQRNNIPFIVDAAAEEYLQKYVSFSDLVIYSGSKAIEGPTSGIVGGKRKYIDWVKQQFYGIGRSMKVGKEVSFGLLQALEEFETRETNSEQQKDCLHLLTPLNELDGVQVKIVQDDAGRDIYRARIQIDSDNANMTAKEVVTSLQEGEIAIYTRDYGVKQGFFDIDPRPLQGDDLNIIVSQLRSLLGGKEG